MQSEERRSGLACGSFLTANRCKSAGRLACMWMEDSVPVNYRIAEDVAVLELNSPPENVLTLCLRSDLLDCLFRAFDDAAIHKIVITAANKCFSAGIDVDELASGAVMREPRPAARFSKSLNLRRNPSLRRYTEWLPAVGWNWRWRVTIVFFKPEHWWECLTSGWA